MRWLIHGSLGPAVAQALQRHGHQARSVAEAQIEQSDAVELLERAAALQLDLITDDAQLALVPFERPVSFARSIVFLQLGNGETELDDAINRLFERYKRLSPARLYTVTPARVKIRQLPGKK